VGQVSGEGCPHLARIRARGEGWGWVGARSRVGVGSRSRVGVGVGVGVGARVGVGVGVGVGARVGVGVGVGLGARVGDSRAAPTNAIDLVTTGPDAAVGERQAMQSSSAPRACRSSACNCCSGAWRVGRRMSTMPAHEMRTWHITGGRT